MKNKLLIAFSLIATVGFSQTNLVPNPTFEILGKKVKFLNSIKEATPWVSPTLAVADLYNPKSKNPFISIPKNDYGEEKPMEGTSYVGIYAYSYKNKEPRTYLQVKLTEKLKAGEEYCVKYHVSLADLSKYATNHLGAALTEKAVTANNSDILKFDDFVESKRLTVYDKQFYWTPICGIYKAKGGEEYLTLGNFTEDEKLKTLKVKRPRGFNKPQKYTAYYYVDNVSVTPAEEAKKCNCDVVEGMENAEVVRSGFGSENKEKATTVKIVNTDGSAGSTAGSGTGGASDKVDGMMIMFDSGDFSVSESTERLDKVVAYLKENIDEKVIVSGFIDESEKSVDKLAGKRAGAVYKYLVSKGVNKTRVVRKIEGAESPIDVKDGSKNMRVEIAVVAI
jgi:outer membrane protein OmpA-like peptidoglycan-associated protein